MCIRDRYAEQIEADLRWLGLDWDRGGSAVIRNHEADLILLETDALELTDIDTPEALKQAGSAG